MRCKRKSEDSRRKQRRESCRRQRAEEINHQEQDQKLSEKQEEDGESNNISMLERYFADQESKQNFHVCKKKIRQRERFKKWYMLEENSVKKKLIERENCKLPENADKKKKQQKENYIIPENADKKKKQQKENYIIPENADKKKKQQKENYSIPENADKKKKQQNKNYIIPENADKKKKQQKENYSIPENADKKKKQQKENYIIPENADKKKKQQKENYIFPEYADKKKEMQKKFYAIPENAERKKNTQREKYHIPGNTERKKFQQKKAYSDPFKSRRKKSQQKIFYSFSPNKRKKQKSVRLMKAKRKLLKQSFSVALDAFRKHCKEVPNFVCGSCNRLMFRKQVVVWVRNKCRTEKSNQVAEKILKVNSTSKCWICITCQRHIKNGKIPSQAVENAMQLTDTPDELKCLNVLERHLISPVIPFMKIITLPKSMQKGVHGPVVCVQSDTEKAVAALPRILDEGTLIKVKLKRKLAYKGHHLYHVVSPSKVRNALGYLKAVNNFYKEIQINTTELDEGDENGILAENQNTSEEISPPNSSDDSVNETEVSDTTAPLYTCLQPVDLAQYLADKNSDDIINVAPAEGNKPNEVIKTEAKSFPVQFPDGKNAFDQPRTQNLTLKRYFNARLFCNDTRFSSDPEYIFFSQYVCELNEILSSISTAVTKSKNDSKVTSGMIQNSESLKKLLKSDEGYKFLQSVRGSPPYLEKTTKNLCAMLRQIGLPTFFVTFSAADRRWPEIVDSILKQQGKEVPEDLDWTQYCNIINSNIVTATRKFDKRLHDFMNDIVMSEAQPIGEVVDIFGRIEFQARGWPHYHGLVWIKNAPLLNEATDEEISNFIEKYICCELPDAEKDEELYDIVSNVQMHSRTHSKSCKKGGKECRFNFPRPPSTHTFISRPSAESSVAVSETSMMDATSAKKFLQVYWEIINSVENENISVEDILTAAKMTQSDFENAINSLAQKPNVILKRKVNECWINAYNPSLLRAWNGNMDIQFVMDPYSCVMYILSYITKAERELGQLIKQAQSTT